MNDILLVAAGIMMIVDLIISIYADIRKDQYRTLKYLILAVMMSTIVILNARS